MFECERGIDYSFLPQTTASFETNSEIQKVCARRLLDEGRRQRFIQQLFCVAKLFLSDEVADEGLQLRQCLRRLSSGPLAPKCQRLTMKRLRVRIFAFAFQRRTQIVELDHESRMRVAQ